MGLTLTGSVLAFNLLAIYFTIWLSSLPFRPPAIFAWVSGPSRHCRSTWTIDVKIIDGGPTTRLKCSLHCVLLIMPLNHDALLTRQTLSALK